MAKVPEYNLEQQLNIATKTLRRAAEAFRANPSEVLTHLQVAECLEKAADNMEASKP